MDRMAIRNLFSSRSRLLFFGCLVVASYFTYSAVGGAIRTHQLAQEQSQDAADAVKLKQELAYIQAVKNYVSSDDYVEQQARRQLGYIKPGEVPYVVISPPIKASAITSGQWWERLFPR